MFMDTSTTPIKHYAAYKSKIRLLCTGLTSDVKPASVRIDCQCFGSESSFSVISSISPGLDTRPAKVLQALLICNETRPALIVSSKIHTCVNN